MIGIGGEYLFAPNWSAAIEYDHLFMGTRDVDIFSATAPFGATHIDRTSSRCINYRWGEPVIAKY